MCACRYLVSARWRPARWLRSIAPYDTDQPIDSDRFYAAYIDFILKALRP